jgi:hypothetical protein
MKYSRLQHRAENDNLTEEEISMFDKEVQGLPAKLIRWSFIYGHGHKNIYLLINGKYAIEDNTTKTVIIFTATELLNLSYVLKEMTRL